MILTITSYKGASARRLQPFIWRPTCKRLPPRSCSTAIRPRTPRPGISVARAFPSASPASIKRPPRGPVRMGEDQRPPHPRHSPQRRSTDPQAPVTYGSIPRLLLLWVVTEATQKKNRRIQLGNSLDAFMRARPAQPRHRPGKAGGYWLPPRDSNPDMLSQSQLSYH